MELMFFSKTTYLGITLKSDIDFEIPVNQAINFQGAVVLKF